MSKVFKNTRSQTKKIQNFIFNELKIHTFKGNFHKHFITPSKLRDYFFNDGFVRILKHKNMLKKNDNLFLDYIFNNGNLFEKYVNNYLSDKYKNKYVEITKNSFDITEDNFNKTIKCIHENYSVISSAPLINTKNNTRGCADLIVKGHVIQDLFPYIIDNINIDVDMYYIIDIKDKILKLKTDGYSFLRNPDTDYFVCQTYIYSSALNDIQQKYSRYSFILGCGNSFTSKNKKYTSNNTFNRIGVIDFYKEQSVIEKIKKYIRTERFIYKNKKDIDINTIGMNELLPFNSSNNLHPDVINIKKKILNEKKDITLLLKTNKQNRNNAFSKGIFDMDDNRCTSENLGITGNMSELIDDILSINRQEKELIRPSDINTCTLQKTTENICFVDTETLHIRNYDNFPQSDIINRIFLIGVYYFDKHSRNWTFKQFHLQDLNNEYNLINNFHKFIVKIGNPTILHWHADEFILRKSFERVKLHILFNLLNFIDMRKIFVDNNIVIKNLYKYDLKNVVKNMYEHKFIQTKYDTQCMNGLDAMIHAINFYQNNKQNKLYMNDIYRYNKIDTIVLKEILDFLHSKYL
jgi:hypothetical protein